MNPVSFRSAPDRAAAAAEAADRFRRTYRREPTGVWSAPGRVNLIGEHVDYSGGLCLPLALPFRTFTALAPRDDGVIRVHSTRQDTGWCGTLAEVGPGRPGNWAGYVAGVAWALASEFPDADELRAGFDAMICGGVRPGSGLSSSAALQCSVAVALADLARLDLGPAGRIALAAATVRAENEIVGARTGGLDQAAALRCTAGAALLLDCRDGSGRQVPLDLAAAGLTLLVIDTGVAHRHASGEYGRRRAALEGACARLGVPNAREIDAGGLARVLSQLDSAVSRTRVRHAVTEIERVRQTVRLLEAGRIGEIGPLLDASHESLRTDFEVSSPELDLAVDTARAAGALGARMTGGGFGGSAIALVDAAAAATVAAAVTAAYAEAGWPAPDLMTAVPSAPADRDQPGW